MLRFWKILESKREKSKDTFEDAAKVNQKVANIIYLLMVLYSIGNL